MIGKSDTNIAISISDNTLKIAQVKGKGVATRVIKITYQDITDIGHTELPKVIKSALSGYNAKSSQVVLVIPSNITSTKNIEIPSVDKGEINSIVDLQAGRHSPLSREEIQVGNINLGVSKENHSKVLLVIGNKAALSEQILLVERAGPKVKKVLFAAEGIARFYASTSSDTPGGIIDIRSQSTDFIVQKNGLAITTRHIPIGRRQLMEQGAEATAQLVEELAKTIESYQNEDIDLPPSNYVITTDDEQSIALQGVIKTKLNWEVLTASYVDNIKASNAVLKQFASNVGDQSMLDVVATAQLGNDAQVNLIPAELNLQKSIEDQGRQIFKAGVLGFLLVILIGLIFGMRLYFKSSYLGNLTENFKTYREQVVELEEQSLRIGLLRRYMESRMTSLNLLLELYSSVPEEIYFNNVLMDDQGTVSIQGISEVSSLVFNLGTKLRGSDLFKSVDITSTTAKKERGKDVTAFEVSMKLKDAIDDSSEVNEGQEQ